MRSRNSTGAVRWLSPRQTSRCTSPRLYSVRARECRHARAGIDVGGTFTDAVLVEDGRIRVAKVPTVARQHDAVVGAAAAVGATDIDRFTHGTTIATNALLERRGARTALVTNEGFEHVLHLRRQTRAHLYRPASTTRRRSSRSSAVSEYAAARGPNGELVPLDLDTLPPIDAEAIAGRSCSRSATRSRSARRRRLGRRYPSAHVVASHEVAPEFREYERASTTAADAYLGPVLSRYLRALGGVCAGAGAAGAARHALVGRLATLEEAAAHAAFALLSGPAAGVVGAARLAALAGFENALSFDMGGTSTDVCAIADGEARREHERLVDGLPIRLPHPRRAHRRRGRGGPSPGWTGRRACVGPESAGGTGACLLRAGREARDGHRRQSSPRAPAADPPGGIELDTTAAQHALGAMDPGAVIDVVNAEMVRALRLVSVEHGLDPRDFALVAFGGAGPLHACALAQELGMRTVLVPAAAGVLSALGLVAADERRDAVRTYVTPSPTQASCPRTGRRTFATRASRSSSRPLGPDLAERFHDAHEARYGYADRERSIELVAVRTAERARRRPSR